MGQTVSIDGLSDSHSLETLPSSIYTNISMLAIKIDKQTLQPEPGYSASC